MVHFDCPQCGKRLDVDAGFRGAVARCEHCGALISVPTKSESASHRARPSAPGAPVPTNPPGARAGAPDHAGATRRRPARLAVVAIVTLVVLGGLAAWWFAFRGVGLTPPPPAPNAPAPAGPAGG